MTKMIQIRNVPDEVHATLKARAARAGMSLSDYLLAEVASIASLPTIEELKERIKQYEPVRLEGETIEETIRRGRDAA
jgi:plasmid stability protein